ncbi:MAG: sensor hybrid histidine kinase [Actinomycetia bacterium]|nr:sensor hybrid histidine kinase [Actinomycetes bacterium]
MEPTEDVLRGLLAAAPDALIAVDGDGTIVFVNNQVERLFGWPESDLLGGSVDCLVADRLAGPHPSLREGDLRRPTTWPMGAGLRICARRMDGSEFPAEISLSAFEHRGGTLVAAAIRDVTESHRTELRFRAVLESAPDAIVGVSASGQIQLVNAQTERLFGWTSDELIGEYVEVLVPTSVRDAHVGHRAGYATEPMHRPMGAGLQLSGRRKDGTTFPAEISLSTIRDDMGEVLVLTAVRDVTDRMEVETERRHREQDAQEEQSHRLESLGQLAGGVAHEFNNLLGVVLNFATLLERSVTDPRDLADVGEIKSAAWRAGSLTRQLLAFARRDVANPEPLAVNDIVRNFVTLLERTLGEHIEVRLELDGGVGAVMADRKQLELVLLNLALNARDAMPGGGVLRLVTERASTPKGSEDLVHDIVLRVVDTGCGMSPEVQRRVFEPFFTTKPSGEGTGLGLATVYGIVGQSGGAVTVESELGVGTTMTVRLPGIDATAVAPTEERAAPEGTGQRVLLVEDEEALRHGTARLLEAHGYVVVTAADGAAALEVFEQEDRIDVVVTDVVMPTMSGAQLARALAARRPALPVLFLSGYASPSLELLASVPLEKPVSEGVLLRAIHGLLHGG